MVQATNYILGLDLDGTCADFYGRMREIAAVWTNQALDSLPPVTSWSLSNWGIDDEDYQEFHRYAVTEHGLFETMAPLDGAPQALQRLEAEGLRIRIITHRLIMSSLHETTVLQTVRWLDRFRIPYWDLCFLREKDDVNAHLYLEDAPFNVERLVVAGNDVIMMENGTNRDLTITVASASSWEVAEPMIRQLYYDWLDAHDLSRPDHPGAVPHWREVGNAPHSSTEGEEVLNAP